MAFHHYNPKQYPTARLVIFSAYLWLRNYAEIHPGRGHTQPLQAGFKYTLWYRLELCKPRDCFEGTAGKIEMLILLFCCKNSQICSDHNDHTPQQTSNVRTCKKQLKWKGMGISSCLLNVVWSNIKGTRDIKQQQEKNTQNIQDEFGLNTNSYSP